MLRCRKESISNAMNEFQWICFLNGYISFNDLFSASSSQPTDHKSRQPAPVAAPPFHMQSKLSCKRLDEIELADAQGRVLYVYDHHNAKTNAALTSDLFSSMHLHTRRVQIWHELRPTEESEIEPHFLIR